jgi:hypothetical protein
MAMSEGGFENSSHERSGRVVRWRKIARLPPCAFNSTLRNLLHAASRDTNYTISSRWYCIL